MGTLTAVPTAQKVEQQTVLTFRELVARDPVHLIQLDKVRNYIRDQGFVYTWDLERWGHGNGMTAGNATRHARTLCHKLINGRILVEHPVEEGKRNKHKFVWIG